MAASPPHFEHGQPFPGYQGILEGGGSAADRWIQTHEFSVGALDHSADVCCLGVDLIRVVSLIEQLVLLHIPISVESAKQEPLAHPSRSQLPGSNGEVVGFLHGDRGSSTMSHHLEHEGKLVLCERLRRKQEKKREKE
jgi:hypothetical protein